MDLKDKEAVALEWFQGCDVCQDLIFLGHAYWPRFIAIAKPRYWEAESNFKQTSNLVAKDIFQDKAKTHWKFGVKIQARGPSQVYY